MLAHAVIVLAVTAIFLPFYAALYRDLTETGPLMLPEPTGLTEAIRNSTPKLLRASTPLVTPDSVPDVSPSVEAEARPRSRAGQIRQRNRHRHQQSLLVRIYHTIIADVSARQDGGGDAPPFGVEQASCASVSLNALLMPILGIFSFLAVAIGIHGVLGSVALLLGNATLGSICSLGYTGALGAMLIASFLLGTIQSIRAWTQV